MMRSCCCWCRAELGCPARSFCRLDHTPPTLPRSERRVSARSLSLLCNRTADGINLEARMIWEIWRSCITISRARKLVLSGPESSQHLLIYMVICSQCFANFYSLLTNIYSIQYSFSILFSCFKIQSQRQSYHRSRRQEEMQDNLVLRYATYKMLHTDLVVFDNFSTYNIWIPNLNHII